MPAMRSVRFSRLTLTRTVRALGLLAAFMFVSGLPAAGAQPAPVPNPHSGAGSLLAVEQDRSASSDSLEERAILFTSSHTADDWPNYHIWRMGPDGSDPRRLTSGDDVQDNFPVWSPDGTQIAFVSDRDEPDGRFGIYVMNADGSRVQAVGPRKWPLMMWPEWSPEGSEILFSAGSALDTGSARDLNLYLMKADGSDLRQLTSGSGVHRCPSWAPDGNRVAYTLHRGDSTRLMIRDLVRDSTEVVLPKEGREGECGYWSPDGRQLAFSSPPDGKIPSPEERASGGGSEVLEIFVLDLETRTVEQLTDAGAISNYPRWSPDGRRIVFQSTRAFGGQSVQDGERRWQRFEIYTMRPDGKEVRRLTNNQRFDAHPSW